MEGGGAACAQRSREPLAAARARRPLPRGCRRPLARARAGRVRDGAEQRLEGGGCEKNVGRRALRRQTERAAHLGCVAHRRPQQAVAVLAAWTGRPRVSRAGVARRQNTTRRRRLFSTADAAKTHRPRPPVQRRRRRWRPGRAGSRRSPTSIHQGTSLPQGAAALRATTAGAAAAAARQVDEAAAKRGLAGLSRVRKKRRRLPRHRCRPLAEPQRASRARRP